MKKSKSSKTQPITLHSLLGAISFWGTATRSMLFGFIAIVIFGLALSESPSPAAVDSEIMRLLYVLLSFVLLDFGYVMIARTYPLQRAFDLMAVASADVFLALIYILPNVVVNANARVTLDPLMYVFFIPVVVLSIRMLLGFLIGNKR